MTTARLSRSRSIVDWLTLVSCGVIAGTLVNALLGMIFRLVVTLVYQRIGGSISTYSTWPLYYSFCSYAFSPRQILAGAVAGVLASLVLTTKGVPLAKWILGGLVFTAAMFAADVIRHATPASATLALAGNIVRGTLLTCVTDNLFQRWKIR